MEGYPSAPSAPRVEDGRVRRLDDFTGRDFGDLSDFFNPFLTHFVREALRGGGQVWGSCPGPVVDGLLVYNVVERVGSIFTRDRSIAETLFGVPDHLALFSDFRLGNRTETYWILAADLPLPGPPHRFTHPVRIAREGDGPSIVRLMKEMYGRIDTSWLQFPASPGEECLLVEVAGEIAGAAWVSVVDRHARLHSLSVRPRYRRMRVGTDLWHARLLRAERAGARHVITEIAEANAASLAIATAGGMHRVGQVELSYRGGTAGPPPGSP